MDKKRKRFSCYSQRHVRRLIVKNTAMDIDVISELTPSCSYNVSSADENSPEIISKNHTINTITEPSTDSNNDDNYDNDNNDNNLSNNIVESDIDDNNIDLTDEFDDIELPCQVEDIQSENEIEFNFENDSGDKIENSNLENFDKFKKELCNWYIDNRILHKALANLLLILRKRTNLPFPKDPRTLLDTLRNVECILAEINYFQ